MRKGLTHRTTVENLGAVSVEMGNTLRARQQSALLKQAQGIPLNRAERRALRRMKVD